MAYKIGTVTNGGGNYANQNFLALIRQFAGGFGDIGTIGGTRTGNGTLTAIEASPTAVTETWTLTCTATATNGGTFSVVGSVSGSVGSATVGTAFTHSKITFLLSDGTVDFASGDTFTIPVTESANPVASRWTVLRYDTVSATRELILQGKGLSGTEQIFVGFRSYQDASADYYNVSVAGFTGYVPGNSFTTQPGYTESGVPAHNLSIGYWLAVNGQRILFGLKVGTPVYEMGYAGKALPLAAPSQYPYPLVVAGMLNGIPAIRFSDTSHSLPFKGNRSNLKLRFVDGSWLQPHAWPWTSTHIAGGTAQVRETGTVYTLQPVFLHNNSNGAYCRLDGVFHISGFNNAVENTLAIGGKLYVVMQDTYRTDFNDYIALEMS
jgi:hypothetical protein